jgi:hypothetical protein
VSRWGEIFLGVIALATLVMAIGQVALMVAAGRVARRLGRVADVLDQELKPLFAQLNAVARDASRAASLATAQVERADKLFGDLVTRVEATLDALHQAVAVPLRQGPAMLAAFRAVMTVLRDFRGGRRGARHDDEDALFI